jgi:hypothetical protein
VAVVLGLALAGPAAALPANPWTGRWASDTDVITLSQTGSQISGSGPWPGTTGSGVLYTATASADSTSANFSYSSSECPGTGGTFSATLTPDGRTINASGTTQFGTAPCPAAAGCALRGR